MKLRNTADNLVNEAFSAFINNRSDAVWACGRADGLIQELEDKWAAECVSVSELCEFWHEILKAWTIETNQHAPL